MKRKVLAKRSGGLYSVTCSGKPADLASNPSGVDSIPSKARTIRKSCTSPSVEPFIVWRKHVMPYMKLDTGYMKEARASDRHVKYCRIVRRTLKGVRRWFVQLVVEGLPPVRKVYASKCEVVGIDPGSSRIAYFHERHAAIVEVAPHVDLKEPKIRLLQRRIDRSRRANNPDGTVKKGSSTWNTSNRGRRTAARSKLRKTITDLFNAASDGRQTGGEWVSLWSISNARLKAPAAR